MEQKMENETGSCMYMGFIGRIPSIMVTVLGFRV